MKSQTLIISIFLPEHSHVTFWKVPRTIHSSKLCNGCKLVSVGLCLFLYFSFLCHLCASCFYFWPPGSDPRVQPLKIGGWHVILFISPYGHHGRLQAWLDNHNSLNGIFLKCSSFNVLWTCWSSFVLDTGKLDTQGNLSLSLVRRNVKVTYICTY